MLFYNYKFSSQSLQRYLWFFPLMICLVYEGVFYENTNDTVAQTYINGYFSNQSVVFPNTFGCFTLLSYLLNWLFIRYPNIYWYDGFQLTILVLSCLYLYFLLMSSIKEKRVAKIVFRALLFLVIAGVFLRPAEFTRTTILLAGLSMVGMYRMKSSNSFTFLLCQAIFLISLLMRIEAAAVSFLLVSAHFFASSTNSMLWLRKFVFSGILMVGISILVNTPITNIDNDYLNIRPYEYAITDFDKEHSSVKLENKEDSVVFHACTQFFFADVQHADITFFKKIGLGTFDKTPVSLIKKFILFDIKAVKIHQFFDVLVAIKWLVLTWLCSVLFFFYSVPFSAKHLLTNMFSVFVITWISVFMKSEAHVIAPLFAILLLLNLLTVFENVAIFPHKGRNYLILGALLIILPNAIFCQKETSKEKIVATDYYFNVAKYLSQHPHESILLNVSSWDQGHRKMFQRNHFSSIPNAFVLDGGILYGNTSYQQLMKEVTGSDTFIGHWEYFVGKRHCTFLSSLDRMNMLVEYVNTVYGKQYEVECIKVFNTPIIGEEPLCLFNVVASNRLN